ncbi:hypothetical protein CR513_57061, partial [Mucuna pruriens]
MQSKYQFTNGVQRDHSKRVELKVKITNNQSDELESPSTYGSFLWTLWGCPIFLEESDDYLLDDYGFKDVVSIACMLHPRQRDPSSSSHASRVGHILLLHPIFFKIHPKMCKEKTSSDYGRNDYSNVYSKNLLSNEGILDDTVCIELADQFWTNNLFMIEESCPPSPKHVMAMEFFTMATLTPSLEHLMAVAFFAITTIGHYFILWIVVGSMASDEYENGVKLFLNFAKTHASDSTERFYFSCFNCFNEGKLKVKEIWDHLMQKSHYTQRCTNFKRLSTVLRLFNLKVKNGWTNKIFPKLLELLKDMLHEGNTFPNCNSEAKKILCLMGMDYKKIHTCPNNCILYKKQFKSRESQYIKKDSDYSGDISIKGPPTKVLWYLPIIPRFKRLFANSDDVKNLR